MSSLSGIISEGFLEDKFVSWVKCEEIAGKRLVHRVNIIVRTVNKLVVRVNILGWRVNKQLLCC